MAITLPRETTQRLTNSIKQFVAGELEQEIGDLKAGTVLEFFLKEMAPTVYNRGVADAQAYLQDRLADLEGACYEQEFAYWSPGGRGGRAPRRGSTTPGDRGQP